MNRKLEKDSTHRDEFHKENQRIKEDSGPVQAWMTRDPRMLHIRHLAEKLAQVEVPVLITGESGTGKEVMSRYIHQQSLRRNQPFIAVNCAAIPSELVESELFGYEKGAFSGAHTMKPGAFELADRGTLFLDEIGEMPLQVQSKLLRAVEHHRFRRIGGKQEVNVDIRILAATNQSVRQKIRTQEFREDLFYRLSVAEIELPPLRERSDDIRFLVEYFLQKFSHKYKKWMLSMDDQVLQHYQHYSWPGNVRELRNVVERAVLFSDNGRIQESFLPAAASSRGEKPVIGLRFMDFRQQESAESSPQHGVVVPIGSSLEKAEQLIIERTLASVGNNKSEAARILGCSRKTLHNKLSRIG